MAEKKDGQDRRSFLGIATLAIGGLIGAVMSVPLLRMLFDPAGRTVVGGGAGPIDVMAVQELASGGDPVRVALVASGVRDAWGRADEVRLGSAWVTRGQDGTLRAFTGACPHLGCAIDFDAADKKFKCPCHRSAFSPDGARIEGPSKRGLDPLPVEERGGRVLVTHKRFEADIADRVEKA